MKFESGLDRILASQGAKSLLEAVELKRAKPFSDNSKAEDQLAPQSMFQETDYELITRVIKETEALISDFDIDFLDEDLRTKLAKMPLTTKEQALAWRDAWNEILKPSREDD